MLSYGDAIYGYTPNGSLKFKAVNGDTTWYTYDLLGNLVTVTMPNGDFIEYIIDGQNRRIGKVVNGQFTKGWLYQDQLNPVAELDSAGNVSSRFVYGSKGHVPDYLVKGDSTYRFITDHLGSVRLVVNVETGVIAQRIDYSELGQIIYDINPGFQPFTYAGGHYDLHTKLIRFGARDYHPETGRWMAKEPFGFYGSFNFYSYVNNNPITNVDPAGLQGFDWSCCKKEKKSEYEDIIYTDEKQPGGYTDYLEVAKWTLEKSAAISWFLPGIGLGIELGISSQYTVGRKWDEVKTYKAHCIQFICLDPYYVDKPVCNPIRGSEEWVILADTMEDIVMWVYWDLRDLDPRYSYGPPKK